MASMRKILLPIVAFAAFELPAAELSLGVSVANWTTCVPVATATFPLGCDSVAIEWSDSQDGAYEQIVAMDSPAAEESWTVDLTGAVIGAKRYYRLAAAASGATAYSDPVGFTRFRLISHNINDPMSLAPGVQTLLSLNSTSILPFDNKFDSWPDNDSYATVGLRFMDGKRFIAGVRIYPRYNNSGRLNNRYFYASETYSEYDNNKVELCYVSGFANSSAANNNSWKYFASSDVDTPFECCWVKADNGNVAEIRVFGWDAEDEADSAGGGVLLDFIPRSADTNFYPVVTGIYPYGVDEAAVQVGRRATGEFSDLAAVSSPDGSPIVVTNTNCKVGQTRYYRLRTLKGNVEYFSTPKKFIRFRQLERSPDNPSTVRSGYAILNNSNSRNRQIFDGSTTTPNADASTPIGINFKEGVHVAGFRYYPRQSWAGRLNGIITYAYANDADYSAGTKVAISPLLVVPSVAWRWFDSHDVENTYQYVTITPTFGNLNEMEIYGWTQGDIDAAGDPFWPTYLNAVNGESSGEVAVSWGGGANIESYDVLFRLDGDEQWTPVVEGLPPESTSYTVGGLAGKTNCFFRVVARAGAEQGSPPDAVCFVYQLEPGPGTGLLRMLEGPVSSRDLSKRSYYETNVVASVDHYAVSGSLFSNTNLSSAAAWYLGKLIVPIAGEYTLSTVVSNSDGSALYVDGRYRCGNFSSAGYKAVTMHLDAGQHDVAIGWRSVNTVKYISFNWALENCWVARPVPQSQLVPADGSHKQLPNANFTYDGWDFSPSTGTAQGGTGPYMSAVWREANGSYRLVGHGGDYNGPGCLALLTREATGPFVLVCDFDTSALSGRPSLFVSKSATSLSSNCMNYIFSGGDFGFKGGQGNNDWGPAWHHGGNYSRVRMRIKREVDGTVTFAHKNLATPGADWVTSVEMPQGVHASTGWSLAQNKLWVGVSLFGAVSSSMSNVAFSNLSLVLQNGTVVRIR